MDFWVYYRVKRLHEPTTNDEDHRYLSCWTAVKLSRDWRYAPTFTDFTDGLKPWLILRPFSDWWGHLVGGDWNMFYFSILIGNFIIPSDLHIFQRIWNHQPVIVLFHEGQNCQICLGWVDISARWMDNKWRDSLCEGDWTHPGTGILRLLLNSNKVISICWTMGLRV